MAVELIDEVREISSRLKLACRVSNITDRAHQRCTKEIIKVIGLLLYLFVIINIREGF